MIFLYYLVSSLFVTVIGDCDACRNGQCLKKIILLQNVDITDQLAMDRVNNILYLQLNSVITAAFHLGNFTILKMHIILILETSGMTIRYDTLDLYTADLNSNVYRIRKGTNKAEVVSNGLLDGVVKFMYYGNRLYVTKKNQKNLFHFYKSSLVPARDLQDYTISEFVKTDNGVIFVANGSVYEYRKPFSKPPVLLAAKKMSLSTDRNNDVYFGSSNDKVIYIRPNYTTKLLVYAAYKEGNADKFVFDRDNNVIIHDARNKILYTWKEDGRTCKVDLPHCNIEIKVNNVPKIKEVEEYEEANEQNDHIIYDFFWGQNEKLDDYST